MKTLENYGLFTGDNIVIKVGSNILAGNGKDRAHENFGVNIENMQNIVNSIDYLMNIGLNVFLVSSGAVAVGKRELEKKGIIFKGNITADEKAFLSGIGQSLLINKYHDLFLQKEINVSQNLLTHDDFNRVDRLKNLQNIWAQNIKYKTLAIINENDTISREELKFSDNDELAGYVAKEIKAKVLILLSDINGIYKNFGTKNQEIIEEVNDVNDVREYCIENELESHGSGGMKSKLNIMDKMINNDIIGILANGNKSDIVKKIIEGYEVKKTVFKK